MGAKHVTPEEIVNMHRLYRKLGNYAAVGREIGRSGSTVSKYVQMRDIPQKVIIAIQEIEKDRGGK